MVVREHPPLIIAEIIKVGLENVLTFKHENFFVVEHSRFHAGERFSTVPTIESTTPGIYAQAAHISQSDQFLNFLNILVILLEDTPIVARIAIEMAINHTDSAVLVLDSNIASRRHIISGVQGDEF
jgi:hypothetical protein